MKRPCVLFSGNKGMGRLPARDLRDFAYRFGAMRSQIIAGDVAHKELTVRNWSIDLDRLPLDQGPTPRCVGYSTATALVVGPVTQRKTIATRADAVAVANDIYLKALTLDEWEGEDPDSGTSVRAGMKAAQAFGFVTSYAWAENIAQASEFVLYHGPAVAGTVWPDSMMETDAKGYLNVAPDSTLTGPHAQGHAYCLAQCDTAYRNPDGTVGRFHVPQTWGTGWGYKGNGTAFISFATLAQLFSQGGEIALPVEHTLKKFTAE